MAQVVLRNLSKKYDDVQAVKDVNLHIRDKEFMVLVGPSGCGKTTTLRMVAGLESITAGEVLIGDRIVNELAPMDRDIAMVFQNYALYPHMSVYDNMAFGLKMRKFDKPTIATRVKEAADILGMFREEIRRKFDAIVAFAELEKFIDTPVKHYSSGMYVRLAFSVAAHLEPEILIIDEVLSVGDLHFRNRCLGRMRDMRQEGRTVLFVSHDLTSARQLCNRAILLTAGRISMDGRPDESPNKSQGCAQGWLPNNPAELSALTSRPTLAASSDSPLRLASACPGRARSAATSACP